MKNESSCSLVPRFPPQPIFIFCRGRGESLGTRLIITHSCRWSIQHSYTKLPHHTKLAHIMMSVHISLIPRSSSLGAGNKTMYIYNTIVRVYAGAGAKNPALFHHIHTSSASRHLMSYISELSLRVSLIHSSQKNIRYSCDAFKVSFRLS